MLSGTIVETSWVTDNLLGNNPRKEMPDGLAHGLVPRQGHPATRRQRLEFTSGQATTGVSRKTDATAHGCVGRLV